MRKTRFRMALLAAVAAAGTSAAMTVVLTGSSLASGTIPPWQQTPDTHEAGTVAFYNGSGTQVTSGTLEGSPLAAYAVASTADAAHTTAASYIYEPVPGADPSTWSGLQLSASTSYPNNSAPAPVNGFGTQPDATGSGSDIPIGYYINNNDDTACSTAPSPCPTGYQSMYEIRVKSGGTSYWAADIMVTVTGTTVIGGNTVDTGTWTQVFPAVQATTTTVLSAAPVSSTPQGQTVTLTATVTASNDGSPAGTVQFVDGSANIGGPVAVVPGVNQSVASTSWSTTVFGSHTLHATFTPTDTSAYASSPVADLPYSITYATPTMLPTIVGSVRVGSTVTCAATFDYGSTAFTWHQGSTQLATTQWYKIADSMYRKAIDCTATATNGTAQTSATSHSMTVGIGPALASVRHPFLYNKNAHGIVMHGTYEYVNPGTWSPAATSYTYQWFLGTTAIRGATSYRFLIPRSYIGHIIRCLVTAHRAAWSNGLALTGSVRVAR